MEICLAVLYYRDKRYSGGRRPVAILLKDDFIRYVRHNQSEIFDDALVVLRGGSSCETTLDAAAGMLWMREN